ncbi:MAG: alpha-2-macroglobulin family protein, partial [Acidobacteriota bacterium]
DDFPVWKTEFDYASDIRARIDVALNNYFKAMARFPQTESELRETLQHAGINLDELRDPWGNHYYVGFDRKEIFAQHGTLQVPAWFMRGLPQSKQTAGIQQRNTIFLITCGIDGEKGNLDDFHIGEFSLLTTVPSASLILPESSSSVSMLPSNPIIEISGVMATISGTVTDVSKAIIPGASVLATNRSTAAIYQTITNENGVFILAGLPNGIYDLHCEAAGFQRTNIIQINIAAGKETLIDITLNSGLAQDIVMVSAGSLAIETESSQIAAISKSVTQLSTPRVREYFPETLVWQPELLTDSNGRAQLKFNLADNITTWKISVIASTEDGKLGIAEKNIRAFQPFFVEHNPPPILTEGDLIELPIVVYNYLPQAQSINLKLQPAGWFTLLEPARKKVRVEAGDAVRELFRFRAIASIKEGRQRISAIGTQASDAIEKSISVHPDGEEVIKTDNQISTEQATLAINLPENTVPGSVQGELKIYPNLIAHAMEGIEGILMRPYGCAEQTISSTYPNLIVLRYFKQLNKPQPQVAEKAQRYIQLGYQRLLSYRADNGGFSYWPGGTADIAVTAYALKFLGDAKEFINVDQTIIEESQKWLIEQQQKDGRWLSRKNYYHDSESYNLQLTLYITWTLATLQNDLARAAAYRAFQSLENTIDETSNAYFASLYTLAAIELAEKAVATRAIGRLRALARYDRGFCYWESGEVTPFYGWGLVGNIETTALAVQALIREGGETDTLVQNGLLFLIRQKDRYGIWFSTQATVKVLDTLALIAKKEAITTMSASQNSTNIIVNGRRITTVLLPGQDQLTDPIVIDLSQHLSIGENQVEVSGLGARRTALQIVSSYYRPWTNSPTATPKIPGTPILEVNFDKTTVSVGETVTCQVKAARGDQGYGMLLAEIGLPPGVDIDRASLKEAMEKSNGIFSQYDILPDRLIVYLWPYKQQTEFEFKFRPRFGLQAKSAVSVLYDYYNPLARTVLPPAQFNVR